MKKDPATIASFPFYDVAGGENIELFSRPDFAPIGFSLLMKSPRKICLDFRPAGGNSFHQIGSKQIMKL